MSSSESETDFEDLPPSLQNIVDQKSLKWIFVGGKGGVGKTTTSCGLAVTLAQTRESVLLISTDPAHNLSDAFGQRFSSTPSAVNGYNNLFALEIEPSLENDTEDPLDSGTANFIQELATSIPGIDEAMSFAELMRQVQAMNYDTIVFDTAPTGHTLRLLSFPTVLQKGFDKFIELKERFSGVFSQVTSMLGSSALGPGAEEKFMAKIEETKATVELINRQFKDPDATTFVCVCIPEFLSLFETERLVQELAKFGIDTHNVVVNQVLMVDKDSKCRKCAARVRMQNKYLSQIAVLYDEYHVTRMPLLDEEVRGLQGLKNFSSLMLCGDPESHPLVASAESQSLEC